MFASLKLPLATVEAKRRQGIAATFTEPLVVTNSSRQDELKAFLADFYKTIYHRRNELHALLQENGVLQRHYQTLVVQDKRVSYEDFWQRYFWRCDAQRILQEWAAAKNREQRASASSASLTRSGGMARVQKFLEARTTTSAPPPTSTSTNGPSNQTKDESDKQQKSTGTKETIALTREENNNDNEGPTTLATKASPTDKSTATSLCAPDTTTDVTGSSASQGGETTPRGEKTMIAVAPLAPSSPNSLDASSSEQPTTSMDKDVAPTKTTKSLSKESSPMESRKTGHDGKKSWKSFASKPPPLTNSPALQTTSDTASPLSSSSEIPTSVRTTKVSRIKSYFEGMNINVEKSSSDRSSSSSIAEKSPKKSENKSLEDETAPPPEAPLLRMWSHDDPSLPCGYPIDTAPSSCSHSLVENTGQSVSKSADTGLSKTSSLQNRTWTLARIAWGVSCTILLLVLVSYSFRDALCAPAIPGYELGAAVDTAYLEAPWWAPAPYKAGAFWMVCGNDRKRLSVEWMPCDKKKSHGRLILHVLNGETSSETFRRDWRRLSLVRFSSRTIAAVDHRGYKEDISAPWARK